MEERKDITMKEFKEDTQKFFTKALKVYIPILLLAVLALALA
jgi:hypothetical protein